MSNPRRRCFTQALNRIHQQLNGPKSNPSRRRGNNKREIQSPPLGVRGGSPVRVIPTAANGVSLGLEPTPSETLPVPTANAPNGHSIEHSGSPVQDPASRDPSPDTFPLPLPIGQSPERCRSPVQDPTSRNPSPEPPLASAPIVHSSERSGSPVQRRDLLRFEDIDPSRVITCPGDTSSDENSTTTVYFTPEFTTPPADVSGPDPSVSSGLSENAQVSTTERHVTFAPFPIRPGNHEMPRDPSPESDSSSSSGSTVYYTPQGSPAHEPSGSFAADSPPAGNSSHCPHFYD